jgi:hypothetical protein
MLDRNDLTAENAENTEKEKRDKSPDGATEIDISRG